MAAFCSMNFIRKLDVKTYPTNIQHLERLVRIFCLNALLKHSTFLAVMNHLKPDHFRTIESVMNSEIKAIRP